MTHIYFSNYKTCKSSLITFDFEGNFGTKRVKTGNKKHI